MDYLGEAVAVLFAMVQHLRPGQSEQDILASALGQLQILQDIEFQTTIGSLKEMVRNFLIQIVK